MNGLHIHWEELAVQIVVVGVVAVVKGVGWMLKDLMKVDKLRLVNYVKQLRQRGVSSTITLYAIRDLKGAERAAVLANI